MRSGIRLGSILGIPITIDYSWFLIFALITYTISIGYEAAYPDLAGASRWGLALGTSLLFFASLLFHELSHSVVARAKGIPVHGITLFLFGGVSRITREAERPGTELAIAIVGPVTSAILGLGFLGIYFALRSSSSSYLADASQYLSFINFALAIFNMMPGFPLDGGRVLRAIVWKTTNSYSKANNVATRAGQIVAGMLITAGVVLIFIPTTNVVQGLWPIFLGWYLLSAASASRRQLRLKDHLTRYKVRDAMSRSCPTVPHSLTLDMLVDGYMVPTGCRVFLVASFSEPRGIVTTRQVRTVGRNRWRETRVESIMLPLDKMPVVGPDEDAYHTLELMAEADIAELPVVEDGVVVGLVSREDVLRIASTRSELSR